MRRRIISVMSRRQENWHRESVLHQLDRYGDAHAGLDAKPSLFGVRVDVGAKVGGRASIDGSDRD